MNREETHEYATTATTVAVSATATKTIRQQQIQLLCENDQKWQAQCVRKQDEDFFFVFSVHCFFG